jgi:hypothetical protein
MCEKHHKEFFEPTGKECALAFTLFDILFSMLRYAFTVYQFSPETSDIRHYTIDGPFINTAATINVSLNASYLSRRTGVIHDHDDLSRTFQQTDER